MNDEEYVWGKIGLKWHLLRKVSGQYINYKYEVLYPYLICRFELMPGMIWKYRNGSSIIKIVNKYYRDYIYYSKEQRLRGEIRTWVTSTLWGGYIPEFNPADYMLTN